MLRRERGGDGAPSRPPGRTQRSDVEGSRIGDSTGPQACRPPRATTRRLRWVTVCRNETTGGGNPDGVAPGIGTERAKTYGRKGSQVAYRMLLTFGLLIALCCWGYQASIFFNTGHWSPVPLLPLIDQWLPEAVFTWLNQPSTAVELSHYTSWVLNGNAGLMVLILAYCLQLAIKPRG